MKVVIAELIWPEAIERLRLEAEVVYREDLWRDPAALAGHLAGADALIVRNQTRVDAALLAGVPHLRVVGRLGVGLDNIDLAAARQRGIRVVCAQGANAVAVAEYVFAAMLAVARRLEAASLDVAAGRWDRRRFTGTELFGKTLGIVGLGDIGARLARRAQAFGVRVLAYDPYVADTALAVAEFGVERVEPDRLLAESDYVSLHVPLTPSTRGLIGAAALARMKPGAWLIDTARGGVVDEAALYEALREGHLGGAVLDVREQEPPPAGDPLARLPNVIPTPHVAGLTQESLGKTAFQVAGDVLRVLRGLPPLCAAV